MGREKDVRGYRGEVTPINVRQHSVMHVVVSITKQEYIQLCGYNVHGEYSGCTGKVYLLKRASVPRSKEC